MKNSPSKEIVNAIDVFLKQWRDNSNLKAVLLTGSYSIGNPSKNSDVDLLIILDETDWEERGNKLIDGYLIEYIAKPLSLWEKILSDEKRSGKLLFSYMFTIAKPVLVKDIASLDLITLSNDAVINSKLPKPTKEEIEMMKYHLHDRLNDLKDAHDNKSPSYSAVYYFLLSTIISSYAKFNCLNIPSTSKVYKYLKDKSYQDKYNLKPFHDKAFIDYCLECYENPTFENIQKLTLYVSDKIGGFDFNNWKLRNNIH